MVTASHSADGETHDNNPHTHSIRFSTEVERPLSFRRMGTDGQRYAHYLRYGCSRDDTVTTRSPGCRSDVVPTTGSLGALCRRLNVSLAVAAQTSTPDCVTLSRCAYPPPPSEHRVSLLPRVRTARLTEVGCQGRHEEDTVGKIRIRLDRVQNALENNRIDVADNLGPIGVKYKFESDLFVIFLIAGRFFTSSICVSRPSGIVWRMSTGARR